MFNQTQLTMQHKKKSLNTSDTFLILITMSIEKDKTSFPSAQLPKNNVPLECVKHIISVSSERGSNSNQGKNILNYLRSHINVLELKKFISLKGCYITP